MKNPYTAYYPFFFVLVNVFICFFIYFKNKLNFKIILLKSIQNILKNSNALKLAYLIYIKYEQKSI